MQLVLAALLLAQVCGIAFGQNEPNRLCNKCTGKLELGIVLDASSSIHPADFTKAKTFLKEYLSRFEIKQDGVRVSLITYGRGVYPEDSFNLTTYNSTADIAAAVEKIPHKKADYTGTGDGIKFMREQQLAPRFVREGVARVSVVITDGDSQEVKKTSSEAKLARDDGIHVFAIGVGQNIKNLELRSIAGVESQVDRVDSYDKLTTITDWLAQQTCQKKEG